MFSQTSIFKMKSDGLFFSNCESQKQNKKEIAESANRVVCKAAEYVSYVSLRHVHSFKLTRPSLSRV